MSVEEHLPSFLSYLYFDYFPSFPLAEHKDSLRQFQILRHRTKDSTDLEQQAMDPVHDTNHDRLDAVKNAFEKLRQLKEARTKLQEDAIKVGNPAESIPSITSWTHSEFEKCVKEDLGAPAQFSPILEDNYHSRDEYFLAKGYASEDESASEYEVASEVPTLEAESDRKEDTAVLAAKNKSKDEKSATGAPAFRTGTIDQTHEVHQCSKT